MLRGLFDWLLCLLLGTGAPSRDTEGRDTWRRGLVGRLFGRLSGWLRGTAISGGDRRIVSTRFGRGSISKQECIRSVWFGWGNLGNGAALRALPTESGQDLHCRRDRRPRPRPQLAARIRRRSSSRAGGSRHDAEWLLPQTPPAQSLGEHVHTRRRRGRCTGRGRGPSDQRIRVHSAAPRQRQHRLARGEGPPLCRGRQGPRTRVLRWRRLLIQRAPHCGEVRELCLLLLHVSLHITCFIQLVGSA